MAVAEREIQAEQTPQAAAKLELTREQVEALRDICNGASRDSTRQILTGVHFEHGKAYVTDGYIAVKRPLGGFEASVTVEAKALQDACKQALKSIPFGDPVGWVTLTLGERPVLDWQTGAAILPTIEGDFPQMEQLFPDHSMVADGPATIAWNPYCLGRLFKALGCDPKTAQGAGTKGVKFSMADALKPAIVTPIDPGNPAVGLVMPVRLS